MASVVKMGSAVYLKFNPDMDELSDMKFTFERIGGESFVFDLTSIKSMGRHALNELMNFQEEARKKGDVYILTPESNMREELLNLHAIKDCEIYKDRNEVRQALKEKAKGHFPI